MTNVETYARTCVKFNDGSEVPVTKGDLFMVFTGLSKYGVHFYSV